MVSTPSPGTDPSDSSSTETFVVTDIADEGILAGQTAISFGNPTPTKLGIGIHWNVNQGLPTRLFAPAYFGWNLNHISGLAFGPGKSVIAQANLFDPDRPSLPYSNPDQWGFNPTNPQADFWFLLSGPQVSLVRSTGYRDQLIYPTDVS